MYAYRTNREMSGLIRVTVNAHYKSNYKEIIPYLGRDQLFCYLVLGGKLGTNLSSPCQ